MKSRTKKQIQKIVFIIILAILVLSFVLPFMV